MANQNISTWNVAKRAAWIAVGYLIGAFCFAGLFAIIGGALYGLGKLGEAYPAAAMWTILGICCLAAATLVVVGLVALYRGIRSIWREAHAIELDRAGDPRG